MGALETRKVDSVYRKSHFGDGHPRKKTECRIACYDSRTATTLKRQSWCCTWKHFGGLSGYDPNREGRTFLVRDSKAASF